MWTVLLISLATNRNRYYVVGDESCYTSISIPYTPHTKLSTSTVLCAFWSTTPCRCKQPDNHLHALCSQNSQGVDSDRWPSLTWNAALLSYSSVNVHHESLHRGMSSVTAMSLYKNCKSRQKKRIAKPPS
jgi:hypothetical protein